MRLRIARHPAPHIMAPMILRLLACVCSFTLLYGSDQAGPAPKAPEGQPPLIPQLAGLVVDQPPFRFATDVGDTDKERRAFALRILKPVMDTTQYFQKVYGLRDRCFDDYAEHFSANKYEKLIRINIWKDYESFRENYQKRYDSKSIPGAFWGINVDKDAYGKSLDSWIREMGTSSEGSSDEQVLRHMYHEMGHMFMRHYMVVGVEVPSWLEEGTAELFQFRVGNGTKPEAERLQRQGWVTEMISDRMSIPWSEFIKVRNLDNLDFTWKDPLRSTIQYAQAWSVTEFLIATPDRADAYMKMLADFKKRGEAEEQNLLRQGLRGDGFHDKMRAFLYTVQEDCVKKAYKSDLLQVEDVWKDWVNKNYEKDLKKKPAIRYHRGEWQLMRANHAKGAEQARMLARAEALFNECMEKAPNDPEGWVGAGRLALERDQYDKAWEAFGTALAKGATNSEAQLYGGIGFVLRGESAAGVAPLTKVAADRPNDFASNYWLGVALTASRGDTVRAAQVFTIAGGLERGRAGQCSWWEGIAHLVGGRAKPARLAFMRALGEPGAPPETLHWFAIAQAIGGEASEAVTTLERAEKGDLDELTALLKERFTAGKPAPAIKFSKQSHPMFNFEADYVMPEQPKDPKGKKPKPPAK